MSFFNYHAKAKRLIKEGQLVDYIFVDNYNGIKPAMVLFFKDSRPMPIREYKWAEYIDLINNLIKK